MGSFAASPVVGSLRHRTRQNARKRVQSTPSHPATFVGLTLQFRIWQYIALHIYTLQLNFVEVCIGALLFDHASVAGGAFVVTTKLLQLYFSFNTFNGLPGMKDDAQHHEDRARPATNYFFTNSRSLGCAGALLAAAFSSAYVSFGVTIWPSFAAVVLANLIHHRYLKNVAFVRFLFAGLLSPLRMYLGSLLFESNIDPTCLLVAYCIGGASRSYKVRLLEMSMLQEETTGGFAPLLMATFCSVITLIGLERSSPRNSNLASLVAFIANLVYIIWLSKCSSTATSGQAALPGMHNQKTSVGERKTSCCDLI